MDSPVAQAEGRLEKLEEKLQAKRDAIQELQDAWRVQGNSEGNDANP